jgi:RNA polymerase sigma-70 factor (TIGR02957 family)
MVSRIARLPGLPCMVNRARALPYTVAVDDDSGLEAFERVRRRLFGIAYRMLGSAAEAEDIVQETWLRWQATERGVVRDPGAFLATAATRLAINQAQSARVRREAYVGPWLPEPVDTRADPALGAERADALGIAVLLLCEKLSPTERAAYVLHEAFDYAFKQVAEILEIEEAHARQLCTRARQHLERPARRAPVGAEEQERLLRAFVAAAQAGDLAGLERLLAADVVSTSDGGGVARAAPVPVVGRARVSRFVRSFASHFWTGVELAWIEANGAPALRLTRDGVVCAVAAIEASEDGIEQLLWMLNPEKLGAAGGQEVGEAGGAQAGARARHE